jgi:hypothetical protein
MNQLIDNYENSNGRVAIFMHEYNVTVEWLLIGESESVSVGMTNLNHAREMFNHVKTHRLN